MAVFRFGRVFGMLVGLIQTDGVIFEEVAELVMDMKDSGICYEEERLEDVLVRPERRTDIYRKKTPKGSALSSKRSRLDSHVQSWGDL